VHTRAGPRPEQARAAELSWAARSSDKEQEQSRSRTTAENLADLSPGTIPGDAQQSTATSVNKTHKKQGYNLFNSLIYI
jgi:hypothetical protein